MPAEEDLVSERSAWLDVGGRLRIGLGRRAVLSAGLGLSVAAALRGSVPSVVAQATQTPGGAGPGSGGAPVGGAVASPPGTPTAIPAATPAATPMGISISAATPEAERPRRGGTVRVVRPGSDVTNFNPAAFAQDTQIPLSYLEPLLRPDPATLEPRPWLATRWEWQDDWLRLLLTLRDGVVWHDGTPFTAADAAFSHTVYQQDRDSAVSGLFELVDNVEAAADDTLSVRFRERDGNWLFNVASLPIFSSRQYRDSWEGLPASERTLSGFDWSTSPPMGTGPWQVTDWQQTSVEFARFNRYWGAETWLDRLTVEVRPGHAKLVTPSRPSEPAIVWPVRPHDLASLATASGTARAVPAASVMFAAFNFANPSQPSGSVWTDQRVRRAASLAIDRERYARDVFAGFMQWDAAGTVAQPWAHDAKLKTPAVDPAAAALLLADAGWVDYNSDGVLEDVNGAPLQLSVILRADSRPELAAVLARVARDLAGVGMASTIEALSDDDFEERWIRRRDYDLIAYAYDLLPGFTDFDLYGSAWDVRANPAGWNPGGYANPDADAAIDEFLAAVTIERQAAALQRLQRAVDDDLFGLWLGFPEDIVLIGDGIEGFHPDMAWQTARTWDLWRS
jgi:peptide/nickel transport system substrate-binding protein